MRLIFDSNILIAAFGTRGICKSLFEYSIEHYEIVISQHIIGEVRRILADKFRIPVSHVERITDFLIDSCIFSDYKIFTNQLVEYQ